MYMSLSTHVPVSGTKEGVLIKRVSSFLGSFVQTSIYLGPQTAS